MKLAQQRRDKAGEDLDLFLATQTSLVEEQERELTSFRGELSLTAAGGVAEDVESVRSKLQGANEQRASAESAQQQAVSVLREARSALDTLTKQMSETASERKNVEANFRYREAKAELLAKQNEASIKQAELNSVGSAEQLAAVEKDQKELQAVTAKVERLRGHRDTLKAQKVDLESKIKRAEPKKVQSDLVEKMVELEATKLAIKDVDDYHTALDQALMK